MSTKYFCPNCGSATSPEDKFCLNCGANLKGSSQQPQQPQYQQPQYQQPQHSGPYSQAQPMYVTGRRPGSSEYSRTVALILFLFFGGLGIHYYYVGKIGLGLLFMFTLGGFGIWALIDFILILSGSFTDNKGLPLTEW